MEQNESSDCSFTQARNGDDSLFGGEHAASNVLEEFERLGRDSLPFSSDAMQAVKLADCIESIAELDLDSLTLRLSNRPSHRTLESPEQSVFASVQSDYVAVE